MEIKKYRYVWYVACVLFCIYCLYSLIVDSYEFVYEKGNETEPIERLICENLRDLYPNKMEIDLKGLRNDLYRHFNSSDTYVRTLFSTEFEKSVLNRTKSGFYLIYNGRVCLIVNAGELLITNLFLPDRVFFAIKRDTLDLVKLSKPSDLIDQVVVLKKGHPYSDCDKSNSRFHCLNHCFKRGLRLSKYFYESSETGLIYLNLPKNRSIEESDKNCFKECKRENCKIVQLFLNDAFGRTQEVKIFEARPRLSDFDFWAQLIGLIFSFVGFFFNKFSSIVMKLIKSPAKRRKTRIYLFYLNLAILFLSLTYFCYLCIQVFLDYRAEKNPKEEKEKIRNLIQPKTVYLAICVYIGSRYEDKTMLEMERATEGLFDDALEGIWMNYQQRSFRVDYRVNSKVIFFNNHRCFPISIELNYPIIPSNPKLITKFKKGAGIEFYLLSEKENLNQKSFKYSGAYAFIKYMVTRSGDCLDYEERNGVCTSSWNCLERCIAREFMKRYNKVSFRSSLHPLVVEKDWFSQTEWNTARQMNNESIYEDILAKCLREIPDKGACLEIKFKETVEITQPDYQTKEIDLRFDVVGSVAERSSSYKLALDLLGIQSIFLGFTVLKMFWIVYNFIEPKWRMRMRISMRNAKIVWFLICLFCSLGCSWSTYQILNMIVNGELAPAAYYELIKRAQKPEMVFCDQIDAKLIDSNHRLTGNYLEELTKEMDTNGMFANIFYLDDSNKWNPFDLSLVEPFFFLDMKCFMLQIDQQYKRDQFHFSSDYQVLKLNFSRTPDNSKKRLVYFMTKAKKTVEFSKITNLTYTWDDWDSNWVPSHSITHETSVYKYEDRFSFFRRRFPPLQEGDASNLHGQLLELRGNEHNLWTLNFPVKRKGFGSELQEDLFQQLFSARKQKNQKQRTNLNYKEVFFSNHLKKDLLYQDSAFTFSLVFLQKIVHSTNEINHATLIISLLNLFSIWLELGVLDLRPFLVRFHNYFLVYLYLHLPVYLFRKHIQYLFFCCKWLKKVEPKLYKRLDSRKKILRKIRRNIPLKARRF